MTTILLPNLRINHHLIAAHESRWELERFAYIGGSKLKSYSYKDALTNGDMGELIPSRINVLLKIKESLETSLYQGASIETVKTNINQIKDFFRFCDGSINYKNLSLNTLENAVLEYVNHLIQRALNKHEKYSKSSCLAHGKAICALTTKCLDLSYPLVIKTRLKQIKSNNGKQAVSKQADKVLLADSSKFGSIIYDLCQGITKSKITGTIPLVVPIRNQLVEDGEIKLWGAIQEQTFELAQMSVSKVLERYPVLMKQSKPEKAAQMYIVRAQKQIKPNKDITQALRYSFFNQRVRAEYLMFIAMTQGNVTQVKNLKREKFDLKAKKGNDFYQVREWKDRKGGNVIFEIHKSYKIQFESYLDFRDDFVKSYPLDDGSEWLFPIFSRGNEYYKYMRYSNSANDYETLRKIFQEYRLPWITGRDLRSTFLNLLLRRSGDEDLTAQQASHLKQTLRDDYEQPSMHKANIEVTRFWNERDPLKKHNIQFSIIENYCDGKPKISDDKPKIVVEPNCQNPTGCLWCEKHRDIESFDYVWSLCCFRYLKIIESSLVKTDAEKPSDLAIERLNQKIDWFKKSKNEQHRKWVEEAEMRVDEEGYFNSYWSHYIEMFEG